MNLNYSHPEANPKSLKQFVSSSVSSDKPSRVIKPSKPNSKPQNPTPQTLKPKPYFKTKKNPKACNPQTLSRSSNLNSFQSKPFTLNSAPQTLHPISPKPLKPKP